MILDNQKILRICNRLSCQIIEESDQLNHIILVGIKEKGFEIAEIIKKQITLFSKKNIKLYPLKIQKDIDDKKILFDYKIPKNCTVFIIDGVLNTGNTLFKSVNYFFNIGCENIKTIVLIDRDHKKYPVNVDIKGFSLSTNFEDTVKVISKDKKLKAVLV